MREKKNKKLLVKKGKRRRNTKDRSDKANRKKHSKMVDLNSNISITMLIIMKKAFQLSTKIDRLILKKTLMLFLKDTCKI